jgi:hypothetical protein
MQSSLNTVEEAQAGAEHLETQFNDAADRNTFVVAKLESTVPELVVDGCVTLVNDFAVQKRGASHSNAFTSELQDRIKGLESHDDINVHQSMPSRVITVLVRLWQRDIFGYKLLSCLIQLFQICTADELIANTLRFAFPTNTRTNLARNFRIVKSTPLEQEAGEMVDCLRSF